MNHLMAWKENNPAAIKFGFVGFIAFLLFFLFAARGVSVGDLPILVVFAIGAFTVPWLLAHLGARILTKSLGALRLSLCISILWALYSLIVILAPFSKYHNETGFFISMVPLILFWGGIWVVNGFTRDRNGGASLNISQRPLKPKNALDDVIFAIYGNPPPPKTAKLADAIAIATDDLLMNLISKEEVTPVAIELYDSPIPYSTNDLAYSIAYNFLKQPERKKALREAQLLTRLKAATWLKEKSLNIYLAESYESMLYKLYK